MCVPCKEEEDSQMGIVAAELYAGVAKDTDGLRAVDRRAPLFYADVARIHSRNAKHLLYHRKLTKAQTDAMMAQIDKGCYRADELIEWSLKPAAFITAHAAAWTTKILGWAKEDQTFFTQLYSDVGDWYEYAKVE